MSYNVSWLPVLIETIEEIGVILLERRDNARVDRKWVGTQLKSSADMYAHKRIFDTLKEITPGIRVISEETIDLSVSNRPDKYWLIDPIDGTASYVHGFNGFVLQVAYIENNEPILSVIYAPATKECFSATKFDGAFKNGETFHYIEPFQKDKIRIIDNYPEPRGISELIFNKVENPVYIESGSLSLKTMRVIEGSADVFVKNVEVKDWDFAAPMVFFNYISIPFTQYDSSEFILNGPWEKNGVIVCSNQTIYSIIREILP